MAIVNAATALIAKKIAGIQRLLIVDDGRFEDGGQLQQAGSI